MKHPEHVHGLVEYDLSIIYLVSIIEPVAPVLSEPLRKVLDIDAEVDCVGTDSKSVQP